MKILPVEPESPAVVLVEDRVEELDVRSEEPEAEEVEPDKLQQTYKKTVPN